MASGPINRRTCPSDATARIAWTCRQPDGIHLRADTMTRQLVTALVVALLVLCLPNLLWVSRSTAVVRNTSQQRAADVRVNVGSAVIEIGTLAAGASRFLLLPA